MTPDRDCVPLVARGATRLGSERKELFRYDAVRQVSQIWTAQGWVDSVAARGVPSASEGAAKEASRHHD
jgi:hypothetical protein